MRPLPTFMSGFIGCFGLLAIFGSLTLLAWWSHGKRKGVEEFYEIHSLFSASDAPPLVRQAIGAANVLCLKGVLATTAGDEVPFFGGNGHQPLPCRPEPGRKLWSVHCWPFRFCPILSAPP